MTYVKSPEIAQTAGGGTAGVDEYRCFPVGCGGVVAARGGRRSAGVRGFQERPAFRAGVECPETAILRQGSHRAAAAAAEGVEFSLQGDEGGADAGGGRFIRWSLQCLGVIVARGGEEVDVTVSRLSRNQLAPKDVDFITDRGDGMGGAFQHVV